MIRWNLLKGLYGFYKPYYLDILENLEVDKKIHNMMSRKEYKSEDYLNYLEDGNE